MKDQYETYGDCLGLDYQYGGKPVNYIQSDVKFALQARDRIRAIMGSQKMKKTIPNDVQMDLFTRFYMLDRPGLRDNEMMASELHVDFSESFEYLYERSPPMIGGVNLKPQMPHQHGYNFTGMYNLDEKIALEGKGISGYFFDQDDNFAGVALYH